MSCTGERFSERCRRACASSYGAHRSAGAFDATTRATPSTGRVSDVPPAWRHAGDGRRVLLPPHHPAVVGHAAIAAYFQSVFATRRLTFTFTSAVPLAEGDLAVERLGFHAVARPLAGGPETADIGKGLHVHARQHDGRWLLVQDLWNSDEPLPPAAHSPTGGARGA